MTMTFFRCSTPSISARSWGTIVVSTSEEMPEPRVRKSASISSKNTTTGTSSAAFSRALMKISRIFRSVSPTYLLSSSGPLMLRKKPLTFSPRFSEIFCGEVVGHRLGDHGLAAARRPVEQHALRRGEVVLLVVIGVEVRQLDGVLDRLELVAEATDVLVGDVRDLFEREILDLALGQLLEEIAALGVHQEVVADLELG